MIHFLQKRLIRQRLWVLVGCCLLGLIALASVAVNKAQDQFMALKESEYIKLTDSAVKTLDFYHKLYKAGKFTESEAKTLAKQAIYNQALSKRNYYYIYNASHDILVAHPAIPDVKPDDTPEQIEASKQYDREKKREYGELLGYGRPTYSTLGILRDVHPQTLTGFIEYYYSVHPEYKIPIVRSLDDDIIPAEAELKMAYASYFEAWDWVVMSGVYREDEKESFYSWLKDMILLTSIIMAAILVVALIIANSIVRPLQSIVDIMTDISHGTGDLTKRLQADGNNELAQLASAFNTFVEKIAGLVHKVSESNHNIVAHAERIQAVMDSTVKRSDAQLAETEMLASSTNELSASFDMVATRSQESSHSASAAESATQEAETSISRNIESINTLTNTLTSAQQDVATMETVSNKVASVLDVIVGISEQTNLLALNAAIEAARAGEQGRGFAVVADEVRTLAQRTQNSTTEIREIIENLQHGTHQVVQAMDEGLKNSAICIETATEANTIFQGVNAHVQQIAQTNLEIATAVNEQTQTTHEIAVSSQKIADSSRQTLEDSETNQQSSQNLANMLSEMEALVGQFKV